MKQPEKHPAWSCCRDGGICSACAAGKSRQLSLVNLHRFASRWICRKPHPAVNWTIIHWWPWPLSVVPGLCFFIVSLECSYQGPRSFSFRLLLRL